ncbi:hypothetical protein L5515_006599 [Caenorhabditis briggsae]|uniref:Serpentine Receptor, class T n=1 Tax=Caenorhabditis briggsae TaxID=6238 RepID=A0AAE9JIC5_CAEBR|nr:hypothetical protein L5515_006599 [Caenorhabditis briggsae]
MDEIIRYGSVENIPLYNCRSVVLVRNVHPPYRISLDHARTPEQWSLETGERQPITGTLQIAYGIVVNLLYIPITLIMLDKENFKLSCFKIMFQLAITDFFVISINSIVTGILAIQGAVYCTYPTLIYLTGLVAMSLWCSSCFTSLILVCNRILVMSKPHLEMVIFEGHKTYIVLSFSLIYALYFLFTTPHVYNSKHHAWFFDPMIFPDMAKEHDNLAHTINNFSIVILTSILYIPFYYIVRNNLNAAGTQSRMQNAKIQVFIQSILICAASQGAAVIYVFMNLVNVSPGVIIFGHVLWQFVHGAPVFIYIALNDMIRKRFFAMIKVQKKLNSTVVALSIINHSALVQH